MKNKHSTAGSLQLRGQSQVKEVMKHFKKLQMESKKILRGWLTPYEKDSQINQDIFDSYHSELSLSDKCTLFIMYDQLNRNNKSEDPKILDDIKEVHMYVLPINENTVDFCQQMGICPTQEHLQKWPNLFAYLVNIKHHRYSSHEKMSISKSGRMSLNPKMTIDAS